MSDAAILAVNDNAAHGGPVVEILRGRVYTGMALAAAACVAAGGRHVPGAP